MKEIQDKINEEKSAKKVASNSFFNIDLGEMTSAGLQFGHKTSKTYPKMQKYVSGSRNTIHIIDLEKTAQKLTEALEFIKELTSEGKTILFVGTKIQVKSLAKDIAKECGAFYVNERWLGGIFTNFDIIKKRINYFKDLENQKKTGELGKYTKKERLELDRKLETLERKFGGIKDMEKLPDAIFVINARKDLIAIKEAKAKGIKVIGLADTNINPDLFDFAIPANNDALSSVKYILEKVKQVILDNKK